MWRSLSHLRTEAYNQSVNHEAGGRIGIGFILPIMVLVLDISKTYGLPH